MESMTTEALLSAFVILLVTIDPIGLLPIFLTLTFGMSDVQRRRVATLAVLIALCVLLFFAIAGEAFLRLLGIGIPALQIAGGLLLFWIAFEMVFERRGDRKQETANVAVSEDHIVNIAAFPLAIPLIAGPGSITASVLLTTKFDGAASGVAIVAALQAAVLMLTFLCFLLAGRLAQLLGKTGSVVLTRLLGIVLAALAVQTVITGVETLVTGRAPA